MTEKELLELARAARELAYAPYSHFRVGAALLTGSGKTYVGCNIENAAYSATICAERTAFCKAVSEGEREFVMIAIAGDCDPCPPCGVCRQVMREFCRDDFIIYLVNDQGWETVNLAQLLPYSFSAGEHMSY